MAVEEQTASGQERALVERMTTGDERALAMLYDRYAGSAYSLALSIVREAADAEEVIAETFAQVWRSAARFDAGRGSVAAWIHLIARTRALDRVRERRRRAQLLDRAAQQSDAGFAAPVSAAVPTDRSAEQGEIRQLVLASLEELPEPQRRVIEMAYFGGLSQSEIAADLQEPLGTVKTRMRTAMEKLRAALAPLRQEINP